MKALKVSYASTYRLPDGESETISVTFEVAKGEDPNSVLNEAKRVCWRNSRKRMLYRMAAQQPEVLTSQILTSELEWHPEPETQLPNR